MNFTGEQQLIHHLMMNAPFLYNNGLLNGKMGISISFFLVGERKGNRVYTEYATDLLDSIWENINVGDVSFENGLCGIGWGLEYLIQHGFVKGNSNEVCEEIDLQLMGLDLCRYPDFSRDEGVEGFLEYIYARLMGSFYQHTIFSFDPEYIETLKGYLAGLTVNHPGTGLMNWAHKIQRFLEQPLLYKTPLPMTTGVGEGKYEENRWDLALGLKDGLSGYLLTQYNYI